MKKIYIGLFLFKFISTFAHPHVFLDVLTEPEINKNMIKGIEFTVTMDEMNSLLFLEIYDSNGNEKIDNDEFIKLANENFSGIKGTGSHFHIRYDGVKIPIKKYLLKKIFMNNEKLVYKIFIPLNVDIKSGRELDIEIYDKDYYYDYSYSESSFSKIKIDREFKFNLVENKKVSYYMGNLNPLKYEVIF